MKVGVGSGKRQVGRVREKSNGQGEDSTRQELNHTSHL